MAELRQHLKTLSAELHQQVDEAFSAISLTSAQGYRHFLLAHASALFDLEQRLEDSGVQALLDDWPERRRSDALAADLRALGITPPVSQQRPPCAEPAGWCWGALYVLEGSRLGAQLLVQRLRAAQPTAPTNYLSHAAEQRLWPRFLQKLEVEAALCDEASVQRGVTDAFACFLQAARTTRQQAALTL